MRTGVRHLAQDLLADFVAVHSALHGHGWCRCVAWWVPVWDGWGDRTAEENLALRDDLLARGEYDGYLLYVDDEPAGWCQVGPRDRLPKLVAEHDLTADPAAWAVSCLLLVPSARGRGLARALLAGVVADLRARGVRRLETFPRNGDGLTAG